MARWRSGAVVGDAEPARRLARRFVSAGVFTPEPWASALGPHDVTVVVPVRNRPSQLGRLLDALAGLSCVVVDDASADAGASEEIAERHGARFVALRTNSGPSAARNVGLSLVDSALVAFVDSDCVPPDGWLQSLLGHFDDPMVAAVAPRIVSPSSRTSVLARYERVRPLLDQGTTPAPVRPGGRVSYVPSAAIVVRADIAEGPDLFDPSLRGGEDVDLVWRLHEAGWDVRYVPGSVVTHDGPADTLSFLERRSFYGSTAAPLAAPPRQGPPSRGLRMDAGRVGPGAGRTAHDGAHDTGSIHRGVGRSSQRPGARPGGRRDPDRGTWHSPGRASRARRPGKGMVSGARPRSGLSPDASSGRAGTACFRPSTTGPLTPRPSTRSGSPRCTCSTTSPTASGCGRGVHGSERWSHCCRVSCGVRGRGPPSRCDNPSGSRSAEKATRHPLA